VFGADALRILHHAGLTLPMRKIFVNRKKELASRSLATS
jgi:hypothetical protein